MLSTFHVESAYFTTVFNCTYHKAWNNRITVNDEMRRMCKEAVTAYFNALSQNLQSISGSDITRRVTATPLMDGTNSRHCSSCFHDKAMYLEIFAEKLDSYHET
jgi:hypothetical protein